MEKSIHSAGYAIFLKVLREERERAGLPQVQLARKIRETQTFVSDIADYLGGVRDHEQANTAVTARRR